MSARVIGLSGRKRSGKDTFALRLVNEHNYARVAFADPLKRVALGIDPIVGTTLRGKPVRLAPLVQDLGWEFAKERSVHAKEVRRFLQHLGTDVREEVGEQVWIDRAMREVKAHMAAGRSVVLTDVRFPNEAAAVHELGGWMLRVERPAPIGAEDTASLHVSETALDDYKGFAFTIQNMYGIDYVYSQADSVVEKINATHAVSDRISEMLSRLAAARALGVPLGHQVVDEPALG